jgi:glutamate dehydrogenase (NAD(P)+)
MNRLIHYVDPIEGFHGYLAYHGNTSRIAAGGCRVQPGLTAETLQTLAARMALKQRVLGLNVDGAKCGIDYDPRLAGKSAALRRFLAFLRDEFGTRLSMGCDMGTRWSELEQLASAEGIRSVKYAVKRAQGLGDEDFFTRLRMLDEPAGGLTLGQRRAGHALAHAALAAAAHGDGRGTGRLTCALQGFGNLGRAAAQTLIEQGVLITAIADEHGCVVDPRGLDVARMLGTDQSRPVTRILGSPLRLPREMLFDLPADVLILAAGEDVLTPEQAAIVPASIVVVGANCGLSPVTEQLLADRGILVVPDFIGGIGGSASMEALFGPGRPGTPQDVLDLVATMMRELVGDILVGARNRGVMPRQVALDIAAAAPVSLGGRPYGASPYANVSPRPRGRRALAGRRVAGAGTGTEGDAR